jgi:RimJ/RimL family protein N-acetyltransferase
MQHSLTAQGYGVKLRPVRLEDAPFIVWLRNLARVKGWVGDSAADVAAQKIWLSSYLGRENDYYFIIETSRAIPLGTHAIYNLDVTRAEIGRLVTRPGVSSALPASLLLLDLFFGQMGVTELRAATLASNHAVHSLLRGFEFRERNVEHAGRIIGGRAVDMMHFVQTAEDWRRVRKRLIPRAEWAELRIRKWEQVYLEGRGTQGFEAGV